VIIIKQTAVATTPSSLAPNDASISTNLQVWLDANDPANDGSKPSAGSAVTSWKDKSGKARDASSLGTDKAKFCAGDTVGLPDTCSALYFANTSSSAHSGYKISYSGFSPAGYTIFGVFRVNNAKTSAGGIFDSVAGHCGCYVLSGAADSQLYFGIMYHAYQTMVGNGGGTWYGFEVMSPPTPIRGQWVIATMQYGNSVRTVKSFLNGVAMTPRQNAGQQNGGAAWNDLYIANGGSSASSGDYKFEGHIGEILIYDTELSAASRGGVETWLSNKYGVGIAKS
jgi:hypothetical protein